MQPFTDEVKSEILSAIKEIEDYKIAKGICIRFCITFAGMEAEYATAMFFNVIDSSGLACKAFWTGGSEAGFLIEITVEEFKKNIEFVMNSDTFYLISKTYF